MRVTKKRKFGQVFFLQHYKKNEVLILKELIDNFLYFIVKFELQIVNLYLIPLNLGYYY